MTTAVRVQCEHCGGYVVEDGRGEPDCVNCGWVGPTRKPGPEEGGLRHEPFHYTAKKIVR